MRMSTVIESFGWLMGRSTTEMSLLMALAREVPTNDAFLARKNLNRMAGMRIFANGRYFPKCLLHFYTDMNS